MLKGEGRSLVESVFKAAKDAGQRLVKEGKISEDLLGKVSKKLMSDEEYQKRNEENDGANEESYGSIG
jgi:hypothetical protein